MGFCGTVVTSGEFRKQNVAHLIQALKSKYFLQKCSDSSEQAA
jgi:hypothetical protein